MNILNLFRRKESDIESHLKEYLEWKSKRVYYVSDREDALRYFVRFIKRENFYDITNNDIELYRRHLEETKTPYFLFHRMQIINGFFTYFRARGHTCIYFIENDMVKNMRTQARGRKPEIARIRQVKSLREKGGLSFREIARAIKCDVHSVHRWYKYPLDEYIKNGILKV